ncbi:MAG: efflux transporter outer membrane subunit [Salinisphaera sp.]|uniref:efflux transporter outer membrane subunit n=1 Tax=Salinisphaera sp. TaxID=1914330 RepID=UPI003C7CBFFB
MKTTASDNASTARVSPRAGTCGAVLAAGLLLGGCASTPVPEPDVSLPSHWVHVAKQAGAPEPDYREWWQALHDPALNQLVDASLKANLNLASALERVRAARALYLRSDAPYKPALSIKTDDPVDPDARASYFLMGFDAHWELPLFGRGQAKKNVARGHLEAAAGNLREVRVSMVAEVARDWINLRAAQQDSSILRQMIRLQRNRIKLARVRVHLGLASPAVLTAPLLKKSNLETQQQNARHQVVAAAQQLALLTGRDEPEGAWLHEAAVPTLQGYEPVSVPANLLNTRPGIAQARAQVIKAAGELGLARADRYPSIGLGASLVASANLASYNASGLGGIGSVGPIIDIPLFDWGLRKARANAKGHLLKAASLAYREAVLQGVADVETKLDDLHGTQQQLQTRKQVLQREKTAVSRARTRGKLGLDSPDQRLAAEFNYNQARMQLIQAQAAHDIAYVALYKALGGASNRPIKSTG